MISEFLFLEKDATKDEKSNYVALKIEIRQLLKDDFNRKVLSEILLDLRKDISGETQQTLFKLYQDLELHQDAFSKLSSWRWEVISKGILELTQMEVIEAYGFITKFINDKRSTIRKQAEIATVTLRHEGINYFLDTTKFKISEWQQLKLLDVIRNKEDFQPPRFKAWLTSNNKYVVLFALRLIKYYNQNDANTSLIELVKHKNNQIKEEAIACIKEFNVTESLDTLKMVFWNCSIDVKIAILDAVAQIGSETDIEFLNLIEKKELNFSVKSKALSSINSISPESVMPSKGIQKESKYKIPDDITEAVAKIHAAKHAEITGEKEVGLTDEEFAELGATAIGVEGEELNDNSTIKVEKEEIENDEEVSLAITTKEEIKSASEKETLKSIDEIEVIAEVVVFEDEQEGSAIQTEGWGLNHLDFLPIVVEEKVELSQKENVFDEKTSGGLFEIVVVFEEVLPVEEALPTKENQNQQRTPFLKEFDIDELAFLPIVVDSTAATEIVANTEGEGKALEVYELHVEFDEVSNRLPEHIESDISAAEPIANVDFVREHESTEKPKFTTEITHNGYAQYRTDEIYAIWVNYEEVFGQEEKIEPCDIEVIEPLILSTENELENNLEMIYRDERENDDEIELPIENERLLKKIIDDLISFDHNPHEEKPQIDDSYVNPDWELDEDQLDFIPVSFEKDEERSEEYIKIEKNQNTDSEDKIEIPKASIPKAIFGDIEFEATTRQLLNDLEEMGDQREIPFLKELLAHEKYDMFKVRINNLIDTFNHAQEEENIDSQLQPFSVFQDLFRTCDDEAKLILLDEVVGVGDEKELQFLEALTAEDSPEIRKKAVKVLHDLKLKLGIVQENIKIPPRDKNKTQYSEGASETTKEFQKERLSDPDDMFDLNFDIVNDDASESEDEKKNEIEKNMEQDSVQYSSFVGQICSFSNKILEKLNG